ncbi:hypothetical protein HK098_006332 [Nowakowskiella sp. JEL0407]|nr:hypothetical protein HK098_006332 [Nowakowskiella sp. JEL0407]
MSIVSVTFHLLQQNDGVSETDYNAVKSLLSSYTFSDVSLSVSSFLLDLRVLKILAYNAPQKHTNNDQSISQQSLDWILETVSKSKATVTPLESGVNEVNKKGVKNQFSKILKLNKRNSTDSTINGDAIYSNSVVSNSPAAGSTVSEFVAGDSLVLKVSLEKFKNLPVKKKNNSVYDKVYFVLELENGASIDGKWVSEWWVVKDIMECDFITIIPVSKTKSSNVSISLYSKPSVSIESSGSDLSDSLIGKSTVPVLHLISRLRGQKYIIHEDNLIKKGKNCGSVKWKFEIYSETVDNAISSSFLTCIPSSPRSFYQDILLIFCRQDIALNKVSRKFLWWLGKCLMLTDEFRLFLYFNTLTKLSVKHRNVFRLIFDVLKSCIEFESNFISSLDMELLNNTILGLHSILQMYFKAIFDPEDDSDESFEAENFQCAAVIWDYLKERVGEPMFCEEYIEKLLNMQIVRYQESFGLEITISKLIPLFTALNANFKRCQKLGEVSLRVHTVRSLMCSYYSVLVNSKMKELKINPDVIELGEFAELYAVVKELGDKVLGDKYVLKITEWFSPFVTKWLQTSIEKTLSWIPATLKLDKFKAESSENRVFYSSSVIDMCTCISQQIDYFCGLDWPDPVVRKNVGVRLVEYNLLALATYLYRLQEKAISDLSAENKVTTQNLTDSFKTNNLKFGIKSKKKQLKEFIQDSKSVRISGVVCVVLANLHVLPTLIQDIITTMRKRLIENDLPPVPPPTTMIKLAGTFTGSDIPPQVPSKSDTEVSSDKRFPKSKCVAVTIINAKDLYFVYPLNTEYIFEVCGFEREDVKVTSLPLQRYRTHPIQQSKEIQINETLYIPIPQQTSNQQQTLSIRLIAKIPFTVNSNGVVTNHEYTAATGEIFIGTLLIKMNSVEQQWINFANGVKVLVGLSILDNDFRFGMEMFEKEAEYQENQITEILVEKLCGDLRSRIKLISQKYKSTTKQKSDKILATLAMKDTVDDGSDDVKFNIVEGDISPVLDFLDENLGMMMENLQDEQALKITMKIYTAVFIVIESLVVPSLSEEMVLGKEKKVWEPKRIEFLRIVVKLMISFFNGGGDGIPTSQLKTDTYYGVNYILENYFASITELHGHYREKNLDVWKKQSILKLLKLKGDKKFVEAEIKHLVGF